LITGIFTIRNAIKTGYPFIEAILSILPITDLFLISDGGSTDGTFECFQKLKQAFPKTICLFQFQDRTSTHWECIDKHINFLIDRVECGWIFEIQGDELYHEDSIMYMKEVMDTTDFNAIRQPRWDTNWNLDSAYKSYYTVRCIRKQPGLLSLQGGDYFCINDYYGDIKPTLHSIVPFYHFNSVFPKNMYLRAKRHSAFLATGDSSRCHATRRLDGLFDNLSDIESTRQRPENIPAVLKDMHIYNKYFVRDELFDKDWLAELTGLPYDKIE
jgi:hypothetical protein